MPYKSANGWRWGNIERPSKGELSRVVFGIWQKNGSKGKFEDFWETGKVTGSETKTKDNKKD